MREKHYFFTSNHYGLHRRFNEIHPCHVTRKGLRQYGWYWNSHHRIAKFRGYRIGPISFGLISGYKPFRIPYITIHYKNMFIVPTFLLGQTRPALIVCTYGEKTWSGAFRQLWGKLREKSNKEAIKEARVKTETDDAIERLWISRYF